MGGSGFVGTHLALRLREEHKVFSTYKRHPFTIPGVTAIPLDALDRDRTKRIIYTVRPDVIIYAAGSNDAEWVERHAREADHIHAGGSVNVSTIADIFQPKFILLSNSYVFDGQRGNYHEDDIVLPTNSLGKCKLNSENYVKGKSLNYVLLRSSPVFGRGNGLRHSFLDRLRITLGKGDRIELSKQELQSFAPVSGLVELVARLVNSNVRNKVIHYGGLSKMSYYDFAVEFAKRFKFDPSKIAPTVLAPGMENYFFDYSLNSTYAATNLKIKPLLVQESFDLFEQELVAGFGL